MRSLSHSICLLGLTTGLASLQLKADEPWANGEALLVNPKVGGMQLRVLSPTWVEVTAITTKPPDPAPVPGWNFVTTSGQLRLPEGKEFRVTVDGREVAVQAVGFKRRPVYAPLKQRDLRIGNWLCLQLATPVADGQSVEVWNPGGTVWSTNLQLTAQAGPLRLSPAIHVNQVGYAPQWPKQAEVGYYLGSPGELEISAQPGFQLIEAASGREVFRGPLVPRPDRGFPFPCYQKVFAADFSPFTTPGEYRLLVPGLGASFPFFIHDGIAAAFARTYALGLYHQRCGADNAPPFTRFTHAPCHMAAADVPTMAFAAVQKFLAGDTGDFGQNPRHTAPQLKDVNASLYPFVNRGKVDVAGGHHDAGDYSKYTINSAVLIHHLVFAADAFPGVGELDNLGLPESGDGLSDLLQEAKWEADFLAKLQDADGGFYFLVYPRDRKYEHDVLPEHGDPQVVWPKNTAATAAATAALAQCASSPPFKKQFPEAAARYLAGAKKGWAFLERAIAEHGKDGAYQKLTHYGNEFMHDDELAWAACEMFLATGEAGVHGRLREWFPNPSAPATQKWGWWRLYEGYGCAIRSYAFAARSGRVRREELDRFYLDRCENEIIAGAEDQLRAARESAYGTSFPSATKRVRSAGWYFSTDRAFDLAVACQLDHPRFNDPRPKYLEAILSNLNYEAGCNPVNVCFLTGLGWHRPLELVHHYAQNDWRALPPSGLPVGNLQAGFGWLELYQRELGALTFPPDGAQDAPYPIYDRWADSFNVQTEFVIGTQARSLATMAWLMVQTPVKQQPWKSAPAQITGLPAEAKAGQRVTAELHVTGLDLAEARIVWEAPGQEPVFGRSFTFAPASASPVRVEVEAQWPDGRRIFAQTNPPVTPSPRAKSSHK